MNPTTSTQVADERSLDLAQRDITHIEQLLDSDPFNKYFLRRLKERRQTIRERIADELTLTHEETQHLRKLVKEYDDILRMAQSERSLHASTIAASRRTQNGPSRG